MTEEKAAYQCDRSGFMFKKLHKQYEWVGDRKIWTGLMVGKEFLDEPNEQNRTFTPRETVRANNRPFRPGKLV